MPTMQEQKQIDEVWYSGNAKPSGRCPQHPESPAGPNPVFLCKSCRTEYCPGCAGRVWLQFEVAARQVLWYQCPRCHVGLGFVMLPKDRRPDVGAAERPDAKGQRHAVAPVAVRRGSYEAVRDGAGTCLLVLDGKDRYVWVQEPNAIRLKAADAPVGVSSSAVQKGAYLLVDRGVGAADRTGLFLYLQLPHGYQEYRLPAGWPEGGEAKPLQVTPHVVDGRAVERLSAEASPRLTLQLPKAGSPESARASARAA